MDVRPVKLLHVLGGLNLKGGAEAVVRQWMAEAIPGVEQRLWMHHEFTGEDDRTVSAGIARSVNRSILWDALNGVIEGVTLIRWLRCQEHGFVLQAHSRVGQIAAVMAGFWLLCPVVLHMHVLPGQTWIYRFLAWISNARFLFNSAKTCRHFGGSPERSMIVQPDIEWPKRCKEKGRGRTRFVAASAFVPGKNLVELVKALRPVRSEGLDVELHLVGLRNDPANAYEREVIQNCAALEHVTLHEWNSDWYAELKSDDIFVHLGQPESFGIVMLEAFARGCRLVVLRETFLDEFPHGERFAGIERAASIVPDRVAAAMIRAARTAHDPKLMARRSALRARFGLKGRLNEISNWILEIPQCTQ